MVQRAHLGQQDSAELIKDLSLLTNHIRLPNFPAVLQQVLGKLCYFDTLIMVAYKQALKPLLIHPRDPAEQSATLRFYLNQAYLLDPLFNAIQQDVASGVYRLADMAPDSFQDTEYFQTCYQEFGLEDEINLIVELDKDTRCAISLGRKQSAGEIQHNELKQLKLVFPMLEALMRQFWWLQAGEFTQQTPPSAPMQQALKSFAQGVLTDREQEVLGLLLKGHSSKSIGEDLGISAGTVKVHRKNIHAKLNTSSQSEIFTLFLSHLEHMEHSPK
ncbi:HTH-type transcriptional regulator MalT [Marinomonas aquimarina]|uniref:HTH-type transcriptional regulator MalT n=1 Tax=Marinomonas aquimarina TaxID=295068 RepID=A0A1A8TAD4_9GAMM|nr:helix-turn-helix transcriptional regulator [Marinomonas aquimarina]SBS29024.1 HTH-type transcriptional regulator MalT [Marinomonas aquimarina]